MNNRGLWIGVLVLLVGGGITYGFWPKSNQIVITPDASGKVDNIDIKPGQQVIIKTPKGDMDVQKLAQTHLTEMMDGYFKLPEGAERIKYLDKVIDQQEAARKQVALTESPATQPTTAHTGSNPTTQPMRASIRLKAGSGAEQSLPPGLRGQIAEFVSAISKRRTERGLPPAQGMIMIRKETVAN